jgi:hypothetical protein
VVGLISTIVCLGAWGTAAARVVSFRHVVHIDLLASHIMYRQLVDSLKLFVNMTDECIDE